MVGFGMEVELSELKLFFDRNAEECGKIWNGGGIIRADRTVDTLSPHLYYPRGRLEVRSFQEAWKLT